MIDTINVFILAIDTGVLTLIWLVQLVIYPGFMKYSKTDFQQWHPIYTKRVIWVVFPLMLSQLMLSVYRVWVSVELVLCIHLFLISVAWFLTFFRAVPLHQLLERDGGIKETIEMLIRVNGYRVAVWSLSWGVSFYIVFET